MSRDALVLVLRAGTEVDPICSTVVEVRSRFHGRLVEIVAAEDQRGQQFERIAWLRGA